ncbi:tRNA lysidine(34) synthetase TilS [Candidatus Contubernalis alkaliaceticus]|uniref:tRNA lysidine(34) synthetase TilS n=1 Tax=Candidatus Contubernalis alkaliaceticus TaxID=338645 RepID=UPI001F4BD6E9|nr:tRNA lysidine(34) synthetase TilS [Candidatus Contubernalis alkalaceticus]UNC90718.1 tRNA lysidine(34) synthetase TilS [Candidatus Contubernalis alkalaceticus]
MKNEMRITAAAKNLLLEGDRVLVAVSGGPDSVCLLHILNKLSGPLNLKLFVFHLDHQLRGESSCQESQFVKQLAENLGIPSYNESFNVSRYRRITGLSLQDAARKVRLRLLARTAEKIDASKVALGHNSDDQVETILMRLLRGTGAGGLAGMSLMDDFPGKNQISIIRPLLETSRQEIEEYCRENHLSYCIDPSNLKPVYQRNKIRLKLIPYLEEQYNPGIKEVLLNMSRSLARENSFMEQQACWVFSDVLLEHTSDRVVLEGSHIMNLHPALQWRILRMALERLKGNLTEVEYKHLEAILEMLVRGSPHGSLSLPGNVIIKKSYSRLLFLKNYQEKAKKLLKKVMIQVPGITAVPELNLKIQAEIKNKDGLPWPPDPKKEAYLDYDRVMRPLYLVLRWPGARFKPLGLKGSKKVKDFLIDQKVPLEERDKVPLIIGGTDILWIVGIRVSHPCRLTEKTQKVLVLTAKKTQRGC